MLADDAGSAQRCAATSVLLQARVYQQILDGIISLRLAPGTRLIENSLATELNVSRLPVREALRQLEREQLVVIHPNRGASVATMTARDADEIYTLRITLEALAARLAAENAGGEQIRAMEVTLDEAAGMTASNRERFYELGSRFHAQIVAASGNEKLVVMLRVIGHHVARLRTIQAQVSRPETREATERGHRAIFHAIARRQARHAERLMEQHVSGARDRIVSLLSSLPSNLGELSSLAGDAQRQPGPAHDYPTLDVPG